MSRRRGPARPAQRGPRRGAAKSPDRAAAPRRSRAPAPTPSSSPVSSVRQNARQGSLPRGWTAPGRSPSPGTWYEATTMIKRPKIAIVGAGGNVGAAVAQWAVQKELGDLVLIDIKPGP